LKKAGGGKSADLTSGKKNMDNCARKIEKNVKEKRNCSDKRILK
jgi:hypothetical protein